MNAARRKRLGEAQGLADKLRALVEEIGQEEREAFDALPESLQDGERGQRMGEIADDLEDMAAELEDIFDRLGIAQE